MCCMFAQISSAKYVKIEVGFSYRSRCIGICTRKEYDERDKLDDIAVRSRLNNLFPQVDY